MFSNNNQTQTANLGSDRILTVTDVSAQIGILLVGVFGIVAAIFVPIFSGYWLFLPVGIVVAVACFIRFRVIKDGIILNLDTGRLQFPGGGIEANQLTDYINTQFVMQWFKRFDLALNEIAQISKSVKTKVDKGHVTRKYYIHLTGPFGSAAMVFESEGKCDQCYAMIVQVNQMGIPVVNR